MSRGANVRSRAGPSPRKTIAVYYSYIAIMILRRRNSILVSDRRSDRMSFVSSII